MMYYIRLFVKTIYITLGVAVITAGGYGIYEMMFGQEVYSSTASILINEDVNSPYVEWDSSKDEYQNGNGVITDVNFASNLVNAAVRFINTEEYQQEAITNLSKVIPNIEDYDFDTNVTTGTYSSSSIVTVTAVYKGNNQYPADIANALCEAYKKLTAKKLEADYNILYSSAKPSKEPENMSIKEGMFLIGAGAFVFAFALILIVDTLARSEGNQLSWELFTKK